MYFPPGLLRRHKVLPLLILLMITNGTSPYIETEKENSRPLHLVVHTLTPHEDFVRALLYNLAVCDNDDDIAAPDGREAVGNRKRRTPWPHRGGSQRRETQKNFIQNFTKRIWSRNNVFLKDVHHILNERSCNHFPWFPHTPVPPRPLKRPQN